VLFFYGFSPVSCGLNLLSPTRLEAARSRAVWVLSVAFPLVVAIGILGFPLPVAEPVIERSVAVLGAAVTLVVQNYPRRLTRSLMSSASWLPQALYMLSGSE
jgi:hydrogenase/urease accessory protein HupE